MEKLTLRKLAGVLIGSAGLAALVWLQLKDSTPTGVQATNALIGGKNPLLGDAIILGNAFMFSGFNLMTKYLVSKYRPITLISYGFLQSGTLALGLVLTNELVGLPLIPQISHLLTIVPAFSMQTWALLAYMIVVAGFLGYWIHHTSLTKTSASNVALYTLLQPLISAFLGYFLLKEVFTLPMVLAGGLIVAGLLIATTSKKTHLRLRKKV
jgi:drug/metabolite transporter (DMT)-like permease